MTDPTPMSDKQRTDTVPPAERGEVERARAQILAQAATIVQQAEALDQIAYADTHVTAEELRETAINALHDTKAASAAWLAEQRSEAIKELLHVITHALDFVPSGPNVVEQIAAHTVDLRKQHKSAESALSLAQSEVGKLLLEREQNLTENAGLKRELSALRQRCERYELVLREHEWDFTTESERDYCPICFCYQETGHAPVCWLAALLPSPPTTLTMTPQEVESFVRLASGTQPNPTSHLIHAMNDADHCKECGQVNTVWFAPNDVWNKYVPEISGQLCLNCFAKRAPEVVWMLMPECDPPAPPPTGCGKP